MSGPLTKNQHVNRLPRGKQINKLIYKCAVVVGRKDDAWEHYADKIIRYLQTRIATRYDLLEAVVGRGGRDLVYKKVGRALIARRVGVLTASGYLAYSYITDSVHHMSHLLALIASLYVAGTLVVRRRVREIAEYLTASDEDLLAFFEGKELKRVLRRHRKQLPGKALGPHSRRYLVVEVLGGADEDVMEIVDRMHEEWCGTAWELVETARKLN